MTKKKDILDRLRGSSRKSSYTKLFDEAAFAIENYRNTISIMSAQIDALKKESRELNKSKEKKSFYRKILNVIIGK